VELWERLLVAGAVVAATLLAARLVDRRIGRALRSPETITRYRVLRRGVTSAIVFVGILSALLVIPQVRAIAGGLLASSAVLGIVVGFASQRTLGNFVAGIMIALTQPLRLGDSVEIGAEEGTVEEIGLMYTFIRTTDNARLVIPNEKLASDTIRNSTIRSPEKYAEVTVQLSPSSDLDAALAVLRPEAPGPRDDVFVSALGAAPSVSVRVWAPSGEQAERLERELRLRTHRRLREGGLLPAA
jgi:small-conductance mechanosensitive channel